MCRSKEEIDELPEGSCDIFKRNMIDRSIDKPNATFLGGTYKTLDKFCYSRSTIYYLKPRKLKREGITTKLDILK